MDNKILIGELKKMIKKCDDTPEFEPNDYETGYVVCAMLTEVREDIKSIVDKLGER